MPARELWEGVQLRALDEVELSAAGERGLDAPVVLPEALHVVGELGGEDAVAHRVGIRELGGGGLKKR